MSAAPPHGGWTPSDRWDPCAGGHPGSRYLDETDTPRCNRCGRVLDLTPCGCGEDGHDGVPRSSCPTRMREDRRALRRLAYLADIGLTPDATDMLAALAAVEHALREKAAEHEESLSDFEDGYAVGTREAADDVAQHALDTALHVGLPAPLAEALASGVMEVSVEWTISGPWGFGDNDPRALPIVDETSAIRNAAKAHRDLLARYNDNRRVKVEQRTVIWFEDGSRFESEWAEHPLPSIADGGPDLGDDETPEEITARATRTLAAIQKIRSQAADQPDGTRRDQGRGLTWRTR